MNIVSQEVTNLVTWTQSPDPATLEQVLQALTDGDLMLAMTYMKNDPAGRLAWAEYGRRAGHIDPKIHIVFAEGKLNVKFESPAMPVHHGAGFEVKV